MANSLSKSLFLKAPDGSYTPPLFASARELVQSHPAIFSDTTGEVFPDERYKEGDPGVQTKADRMALMSEKWHEASLPPDYGVHGAGVLDSIKENGYDWNHKLQVEIPVDDTWTSKLTGQTHNEHIPERLINGHHRVAVMGGLEGKADEFMPIQARVPRKY